MYRQSPSRTQRSKGIKVKHVLQICFLLVICFWLLYQVKHSHDKKKEFDEVDVKISRQTQGGSEVVKLGRKDLNPRLVDTTTSTRSQDEETEEENAGEDEEIKPEEENAEEKKSDEKGDEQGGAGDEDIEEQEEDKSDAEADHEEDVLEEEKENEEKDSEDGDGGQLENENAGDDHEDDEQAHEAREEHYKADDASSAVTHETEDVGDEKENREIKESNDHAGTDIVGNEHAADHMDENSVHEQTTSSTGEDQKLTEENDATRPTDKKDMENVETKSGDGSDDQLKLFTNTTEARSVTDSFSINNSTDKGSELSQTEGVTSDEGASLQTEALGLGSNPSVNSSENKAYSNVTTSTKVEVADLSASEVSKTDNSSESILPEQQGKSSNEVEDSSGSATRENGNPAEGSKSEGNSNDGTDGGSTNNSAEGTKSELHSNEGISEESNDTSDEGSKSEDSSNDGADGESNDNSVEGTKSEDSSNDGEDGENNDDSAEGTKLDDGSNDETDGESDGALETENIEEVQHDLIDSSDSSIGLQEKEVRTDLETLPEIQTEASNDDDAAAE